MPFFGSVSNCLLFNDLFKQKTPPVPILSFSIFRNKRLLHVKSIQFNNLSLTHLKYTSSHDTSFFLMGLLLMLFALAIERKISPLSYARCPPPIIVRNSQHFRIQSASSCSTHQSLQTGLLLSYLILVHDLVLALLSSLMIYHPLPRCWYCLCVSVSISQLYLLVLAVDVGVLWYPGKKHFLGPTREDEIWWQDSFGKQN